MTFRFWFVFAVLWLLAMAFLIPIIVSMTDLYSLR